MKYYDYYNKYVKNYIIKYKYYIVLVILLILAIVIPQRANMYMKMTKKSSIDKICKLATIQATYHNVGSFNEDAMGIGKDIIKYGYKRYWIEYESTVDIGFDCNKIKVKKSLLGNKVKVILPKAELIGEPVPDKETMNEEYETGMFTNINADTDKNFAYNSALENMKENAKNDSELMNYANERIKTLYNKYFTGIGEEYNKKIVVEFVDE